MAFENVRPFYLNTEGLGNALAGLSGAIKQRRQDEQYGGLINALSAPQGGNSLADPQSRVMAWARSNPDHPAAQAIAQKQAAYAMDPNAGLDRRYKEAQIDALGRRAEIDPLDREYKRAQIDALNRRAEPDPIDQFILGRLRGSGGAPAAPAPQPPPTIQPQSFNGQGPMPGVQLIADQQPGVPGAAPQGDMVDTPYGRMPRDEAQSLAGSMLLSPRYSAAGRAILDSISKGSDVGMSKPAANQIDERTISAASTLGRLQEIKKQFRPEFLQIPNKMKMLGASWGAKFGGKLNPQMEAGLRDYAAFKATAFDNFNQLLKELSGTAVSAQELSRQQIVQPNPGEGLFDGDDPQTFMSKIEQGEKIAKAAMARMNFMRARGLAFNKDTAEQFMRLEEVPAAIDRRGAQIEQELRQSNPQADPMAIERETQRRLKQEFGI